MNGPHDDVSVDLEGATSVCFLDRETWHANRVTAVAFVSAGLSKKLVKSFAIAWPRVQLNWSEKSFPLSRNGKTRLPQA